MGIEFKEGAVCFADGTQWDSDNDFSGIVNFEDFQLNTIKQGDYISKSELDTEDKYNLAVGVFGLHGFDWGDGAVNSYSDVINYGNLTICHDGVFAAELTPRWCSREITFNQLMAIGELKRLINEREYSKRVADLGCYDISSTKHNSSVSKVNRDIEAFKPKLATQYLSECIEVQKQRGEQYDSKGTGERSFAAAASAFNSMTGNNLKGSDACLLLACVKAVRQYSDTARVHEDSLLDLVSYTSLWAEELNKEIK